MAYTMNPIDQYRDPTLDDLGLNPLSSRPRQNGVAQKRDAEQRSRSASVPDSMGNRGQPRTMVDRPTGPPISYRGIDPSTDPQIHRSFSQRAKGRPFAEEAFADDVVEDYPIEQTQRRTAEVPATQKSIPSPLQRNPVAPDEQARQSSRQPPPRPRENGSQTARAMPRVRATDQPEVSPNNVVVQRSATLKDAANQTDDQRNNWASDRSPLQKLEVKLTDISKEEKRARVQEAEMRLRESQNTQHSGQSNKAGAMPRNLQVPAQAEARPVRNVSHQADRRVASGPAEINAGAGQRPSHTASNGSPASRRLPTVSQNTVSISKRNPQPQEVSSPQSPTVSRNVRSISATQPDVNRPASKAGQDRYQPGAPVDPQLAASESKRRSTRMAPPLSEKERNASHQAALQQLIGNSPTANERRENVRSYSGSKPQAVTRPQRTGSSKSRDGPVAVDLGTLGGEDHAFDGPPQRTQHQIQNQSLPQTSQSERGLQTPIGLGVQNPVALRSNDSQPVSSPETGRGRQRKSSVSFKEPFDRRRPVDEWRAAGVASLVADDFNVEPIKQNDAYKAWWEQDQSRRGSRARASSSYGGPAAMAEAIDDQTASFSPRLHLKCGPLLRYAGLRRSKANSETGATAKEFWRGTVMIVTQDSECSYDEIPTLRLFSQPKKLLPPPPALVTGGQLAPEYVDPIAGLTKLSRTGRATYVRPVDHLDEAKDLSRLEDDTGIYEASPSPLDGNFDKSTTTAANNKRTLESDGERVGRYKEVKGVRIYADPDRDVTFWRFNLEVELGSEQQHIAYRINKGASVGFWVPARGQTMNMMFHTCNGFSLSVETNGFSGPDPMWRDVLNNHQHRPFHVMIGGGDQIYNDRVTTETELFGGWTQIKNPHHKHQVPFTPQMKEELETFYLNRYAMWFSQGLFGMANASIPMINIWDDHDIIDGFGSYPDDFMKSPVFRGLGSIAYKYYLLFQHQSIDAMLEKDEPSWVLGHSPGPYIGHFSRSVFVELGQHVAFLGLDCRTERTRDDVLSIDTLELVLDRCRKEMVEGETKHLIVLLGVPIAYPRLVWLENVLTSKAVDPIKALGRAGIIKTKLLNKFDGGVEILDDLDDHWTASHHKDERNILIQELQDLAAEKSVRVTILGGDVHLAAMGQFYSNPKLKIPKDRDHRYMPNIISSAIVNTPPPDMLADILNKRNKVHHLDKYTDENMIPMFSHDVDGKKRNNTHLLPRRNWCSIREYFPGDTPPATPSLSATPTEDRTPVHSDDEEDDHSERLQNPKRRLSLTKEDFNPRNLMRRLSSKGAPPSAYRTSNDHDQFQQRAASFDGAPSNAQAYDRPSQPRATSADHVPSHIPDVPALRPSFHRRPTNLSEKAAKKGNVLALDADGNEFDVNDHVNLRGGLDIVLNCEINQRDPAGITTPYRLLVPALWYDGSSDREKLDSAPAIGRRNTILDKLGFKSRHVQREVEVPAATTDRQSESGSFMEDQNGHQQQAKPRFSMFGSRRKKQQDMSYEPDSNRPPSNHQDRHPYMQPAPQTNLHRSASPDVPATRDFPPQQQPLSQKRDGSFASNNVPDDHQTYDQQHGSRNNHIPSSARQVQEITPQPQQRHTSSSSQRPSQRSNRPLSYTISGAGNRPALQSEYSSTKVDGRPPYDPDAAYVSRQQADSAANNTNRTSATSQNSRSRSIGSSPATDEYAMPGQRPLRGNGIIGRNIPPTSFRGSTTSAHGGNGVGIGAGTGTGEGRRSGSYSKEQQQVPQQPPPGYSGIEAYKDPKPRRRWSLREKARSVIQSFEGRRGDHEDWYSDEEEEEYWEGGAGGQNHGGGDNRVTDHNASHNDNAITVPMRSSSMAKKAGGWGWK